MEQIDRLRTTHRLSDHAQAVKDLELLRVHNKEAAERFAWNPTLHADDILYALTAVVSEEEIIANRKGVEEAPTEEAPAEEAPTEEAPAEEVPAEESPAEEAPTEEAPAEEVPAEESPAEEAPATSKKKEGKKKSTQE